MINHLTKPEEYPSINDMINNAVPFIFDFSYPVYTQAFKDMFEPLFIKHFYMREIGCETFPLFKLFLDNKLNEIMPYYNKLLSVDDKLNEMGVFQNVDLTETITRQTDGTEKQDTKEDLDRNSQYDGTSKDTGTITDDGSSTRNLTGKDDRTGNEGIVDTTAYSDENQQHTTNKFNDTPQGGMNWADVESDMYLTNATLNDVNGSSSSDTTENRDRDYTDNLTRSEDVNTSTDNTRTLNTTKTDENTTTETQSKTGNMTGENSESMVQITERVGKDGGMDYVKLADEYKRYAINILQDIFNDCEVLFMGVW